MNASSSRNSYWGGGALSVMLALSIAGTGFWLMYDNWGWTRSHRRQREQRQALLSSSPCLLRTPVTGK